MSLRHNSCTKILNGCILETHPAKYDFILMLRQTLYTWLHFSYRIYGADHDQVWQRRTPPAHQTAAEDAAGSRGLLRHALHTARDEGKEGQILHTQLGGVLQSTGHGAIQICGHTVWQWWVIVMWTEYLRIIHWRLFGVFILSGIFNSPSVAGTDGRWSSGLEHPKITLKVAFEDACFWKLFSPAMCILNRL